jgi:hypothetical protein
MLVCALPIYFFAGYPEGSPSKQIRRFSESASACVSFSAHSLFQATASASILAQEEEEEEEEEEEGEEERALRVGPSSPKHETLKDMFHRINRGGDSPHSATASAKASTPFRRTHRGGDSPYSASAVVSVTKNKRTAKAKAKASAPASISAQASICGSASASDTEQEEGTEEEEEEEEEGCASGTPAPEEEVEEEDEEEDADQIGSSEHMQLPDIERAASETAAEEGYRPGQAKAPHEFATRTGRPQQKTLQNADAKDAVAFGERLLEKPTAFRGSDGRWWMFDLHGAAKKWYPIVSRIEEPDDSFGDFTSAAVAAFDKTPECPEDFDGPLVVVAGCKSCCLVATRVGELKSTPPPTPTMHKTS